MPRLRKEKQDRILGLIDEGYTNVEISEKEGVALGTVSRYRKKLSKKEEESDPEIGLSDKSMKKLYNLQAMLGMNTLNEAIDEIFKYSVEIMKKKFDYDPESEKTPAEIFKFLAKQEREYNRLKKGKRDSLIQKEILECLGMSKYTFEYYQFGKEEGYRGTFVDFITKYIAKYFLDVKNIAFTPETDEYLHKNNLSS